MPTLPSATVLDAQIDDFRGPWTRLDSTDVPSTEALLANNVNYNPGETGTRPGFTPFFDPQAVVTSIYDWLKAPDDVSIPPGTGHFVVYYDQTYGLVRFIRDFTPANLNAWTPATVPSLTTPVATLFPLTAEGIDCESGGTLFFIASFDINGSSAGQLMIFGITIDGFGYYVDKAFLGPQTAIPTVINRPYAGSYTGSVTAGVHNLGYIATSRSGFTGPISPLPLGSVTITAPGKQTIVFTIDTSTFATEVYNAQVVMTPTTNPYQYFAVPGAFFLRGGTHTLVIDISDQQLIQNGTDVTNNQNWLTQDVSGNGPINPFKVLAYGPRMVYLATTVFTDPPGIYCSEPFNFQQISADQNKLTLPGFKTISSGFVLRGLLYICGIDWTYSFQDTGGEPVSWPSATLVDNRIGIACVEGVVTNASNGWAAIVHTTGLYIFNGEYGQQPLSYMVDDDWGRINWNAKETIRIADNKDLKQLSMNVPLTCRSTVNVAGSTMTLVSGDQFSLAWVNLGITINGTAYTITSVQTWNSATLSATATITAGTAVIVSPTPTHTMTFDYTDGIDYTTIKYSLDSIENYTPRALTVWENPYNKKTEFMMGAGAIDPLAMAPYTAPMDRQMNGEDDALPYADNVTHPIKLNYEIAPQPDGTTGTIFAHVGGYARVKGVGSLTSTAYGLDRAVSAVIPPITLDPKPGVEYWRQFYITSERCSVRWTHGVNAGDYVLISSWRHRYYPWALRR